MIDIISLISNQRDYIIRAPLFKESNPKLSTSHGDFWYLKSGTSSCSTCEGNVNQYGTINNSYVKLIDSTQNTFGLYDDDEKKLSYSYVPNSLCNGIVCLSKRITNNVDILISSGRLSGCMVCSLYLPDANELYFMHIGKNADHCNAEYTQQQKNADLFRCINLLLFPKEEIDVINMSDDDLNAKLLEKLSLYSQRAFIHIYISALSANHGERIIDGIPKAEGRSTNRNLAQPYKLTTQNGSVFTKYYPFFAELLISQCEGLYSVYFNDVDISFNTRTVQRDNIQL